MVLTSPGEASHHAVDRRLQNIQLREVNADNIERELISAGVIRTDFIEVHAGLILSGNVHQKGVNLSVLGGGLRRLIALHQSAAGGVEHSGLGVNAFTKILGLDERMFTP